MRQCSTHRRRWEEIQVQTCPVTSGQGWSTVYIRRTLPRIARRFRLALQRGRACSVPPLLELIPENANAWEGTKAAQVAIGDPSYNCGSQWRTWLPKVSPQMHGTALKLSKLQGEVLHITAVANEVPDSQWFLRPVWLPPIRVVHTRQRPQQSHGARSDVLHKLPCPRVGA